MLSRVVTQIRHPNFQRRMRITFWFILAVLLLFTAYRYREKAEKPSRLGTLTRTAILRWKEQVQRLTNGENVYPPGNPYPNPPIMALILSPLYQLPSIQTAMLWFLLKAGLAAVSLYWTFKIVQSRRGQVPDWVIGTFVLFSLHPILGDLSHGNVNIVIAFLVVATLAAYHRGWDWLAGIVLGLAIACKITPILFIPYFGWKWCLAVWQRWHDQANLLKCLLNPGLRVLLGTVLGLVLWFAIVPGAVLGWSTNQELLHSWYNGMVRPFLVEGQITSEHANQSIPGFLVRLFTTQPSSLEYDEDDRAIPAEFHNFTDIGPDAVRWILRGLQLLFVLGLLRWCSLPLALRSDMRGGLRFAAECSYIILGMLLFSERTWKHHGVVLMVPYAVISLSLATIPVKRLRQIWGSILVLVACLTLTPSMISGEIQDQALVYGSHTISYLLLTLGVILVLHHYRQQGMAQSESST